MALTGSGMVRGLRVPGLCDPFRPTRRNTMTDYNDMPEWVRRYPLPDFATMPQGQLWRTASEIANLTGREMTQMIQNALSNAGYTGTVHTDPRSIGGVRHTTVFHPSDGAAEYLSGYLGSDATVTRHPATGTITIAWRKD